MNTHRLVADLHLHSRYARGTSPALDLATLADGARQKGIDLLAAPDFTHPAWRKEMRSELNEAGDGVYEAHGAKFVLVTEVSCIWSQGGRGRRVHVLVMAPGFDAVDALSKRLARVGRLDADGRPNLGMSARDLALMAWEADPRYVIIPAHVWTPWYGVYGSKSGFDSLEECYGDVSGRIPAVETGLSSDPAMNWRVPDVDPYAIVSFSDAHSAPAMGRELTIFNAKPDFDDLSAALREQRIVETVEFHPEHGKYHLDGHRKCDVRLTPTESLALRRRCPVCARLLTLGVLHRVEELATRPFNGRHDGDGLVRGPDDRPPFRHLLPLRDVLSQALKAGAASRRVVSTYQSLVQELGGELTVLVSATPDDLARVAGEDVARAVIAVREGDVDISAGYDGVYGTVVILPRGKPA